MKFTFYFKNKSSVFLTEHFQASEDFKATFTDCFKICHISFDALKTDYYILYRFFQAISFFAIKVPASQMFEHLV